MAKVGDIEIESKVFETTKEMLLKYGVRGWNMDELSKECGVSKRTLYKIIGNKEELLYKCNEDNITKDMLMRREFLSSSDDYNKILDSFSTFFSKSFEEYVLLNAIEMIREYPRIGEMIEKMRTVMSNEVESFLSKGQNKGFIKKDFSAKIISNFIEEVISNNVNIRQSRKEFEEKLKPELDIIINGIRIG